MKKIFVTILTLFSSQLFAAGNIQAMQGRFQVNTARCPLFQKTVPSRAFVSLTSSDLLLVEFLGSESKDFVVRTSSGDEMGEMGKENFIVQWSGQNQVRSSRRFINFRKALSSEVVTLNTTATGLILEYSLDNSPTQSCELIRNQDS